MINIYFGQGIVHSSPHNFADVSLTPPPSSSDLSLSLSQNPLPESPHPNSPSQRPFFHFILAGPTPSAPCPQRRHLPAAPPPATAKTTGESAIPHEILNEMIVYKTTPIITET